MSIKNNSTPIEDKKTAEKRKDDHIYLSLNSKTNNNELDDRFYYEPMLSGFQLDDDKPFDFLSKSMLHPIWISSMTGGSDLASRINHNLARVAKEYGLGMGLGSCRSLLYSNEYFDDFNIRPIIGDQPMFANLGIAQIAYLLDQNESDKIIELVNKLQADGLIVHINPIQEYMQPEGNILIESPLQTIEKLLDKISTKLIIKEVGQGMGYKSLEALLKLPLDAIEFAAFGGTNFAKLEQLRSDNKSFDPISYVGHSAKEMLDMVNQITLQSPNEIKTKHLIISGGIKDYLDGYYLTQKSELPAIYGQAGAFLAHAKEDYETLQAYVEKEISGLKMAKAYLVVK